MYYYGGDGHKKGTGKECESMKEVEHLDRWNNERDEVGKIGMGEVKQTSRQAGGGWIYWSELGTNLDIES